MSKLKTKKAATKRFKLRGNGSVKTKGAYRQHNLRKRNTDIKRSERGPQEVSQADIPRVRKWMEGK